MIHIVECTRHPFETAPLREMFAARKQVFVDLLRWEVPVVDGRYEVDQYDDEHAVYLIVTDPHGAHLGSARLLRTTRPHILDSLFRNLCAGPVPRGESVREVTRFCLSPGLGRACRREVRDLLVSALVNQALERGITTYTGVAEMGWLQQILAFGWRCRPLGLPRMIEGKMLGALRIEVDAQTPGALEAAGVYRAPPLERPALLAAA